MTKSRPLHDIFEECLELAFQGESIEECLRRYPEYGELKGLLETAVATRKAVAVQPDAEFRERTRQRLYSAMREKAPAAPARRAVFRWSWQPTWAVVTAAFLALLMVGSGTVLASANSMPDQPLYAVKVATEQARLALTPSPVAKAELYAALADRRVTEIVYLAEKGNAAELADVAEDLGGQLGKITELAGGETIATFGGEAPALMAVPEATVPQAVPVEPETVVPPDQTPAPDTWAPVPAAGPTTLPPRSAAPPAAGGAEKGTLPFITASRNGAADVSVVESRLTTTVRSQAVNNSARLRAALLKAPPEAREALLRAIAVSETGYERVLQSLGSN